METDDLRAIFLNEFDAMADYVSPVEDLSPVAVGQTASPPLPVAASGGELDLPPSVAP